MRTKQFYLFLIVALLCVTQAVAAFTPGTYYLQTASGTYVDALAVNSNNPGAKFQSSSATAFTFTAVDGGYTIQNASNNNYLLYSTANNWDTKMSPSASETNYAGTWSISEDASGKISISRQYNSTTYYLGNGNTTAGTGVFSGQTSAVLYTLVPKVDIDTNKTYLLKHKNSGKYMSFTTSGTTATSLVDEANATEYEILPHVAGFSIKQVSTDNYLALGSNNWDAAVKNTANVWYIVPASEPGDYIIKKSTATSGSIFFGTDRSDAAVGTGLYTNVGSACVWTLVEAEPDPYRSQFDDKWHTICTTSSINGAQRYFYYNPEQAGKLSQTGTAPTGSNLDQYLWKIEGNDNDGYTLLNKATGLYVTDPASPLNASGDSDMDVLLTSTASKYNFTEDKCFQLRSNTSFYLAIWSTSHPTVRLYNGAQYTGSILTVSEGYTPYTYTITVDGLPSGGGVVYADNTYDRNTSLTLFAEITTGVLTPVVVEGYQANITMEGTTITVTYTANQVVDNPQAISDLLNRIGGAGTSGKFVTRLDEGLFANGHDKFIIGNQDGKPYIQGSSMTAIATGINWYLNHDAHINISWNQLTADIAGASLPAATVVEKTCDADYRYYLNYCTFGYSMTTWTWDRWQKEIDWMALHGINMPLQIVGLEEVWRKVLVQYNYSDNEAKAFAAGPAFTAWWGMNNLEGWGGTTDNAWFARQAKLGKDICDRMKELGMQPVLPGFAAIVPHDFTTKNPAYASESQGNWGGSFVRPWIMDPSGEKFSEVAEKYYKALEEVLGTSKYYSMDPFHEGGAIRSGKYAEGYKAIYDAMNDNCGSDTKWVIQQWQWAGYQKTSLTAVPAGRLIVLDLFADGSPAFDRYSGYAPQDAVFSTIPNFGGRSGFMGRLDNMASNYFTYKAKYSTLKGIGAAPEAIESVPVVYDLLFELPWMGTAPNVTDWVADYATNRYGVENANAKKAWESIHQSAMAFGADAIQGPIEDVWATRPNLDAAPASKWGKTIANAASIYTPERRQQLISAIYDLVGESANLSGSNYQYDIIEAGGQVMADYAYDLLLGIKAAKTAGNTELFNQRKEAFLSLILGMDAFKGTHQMFRLGNWTQTARDAAAEVQGATTATPDWYELDNARTIITTWGDKGPSDWGLRDYSYRSWQGLLKDYYYPRWEYYFSHDCTAPSAGWFYSEWNWAHETGDAWGASAKGTTGAKIPRTYYTPAPEGNTVEEANKLLQKYILPIKLSDESVKYAYRALTTDLSSVLTVEVLQGGKFYLPVVGETNIDGETVTAQLKIDDGEAGSLTIPVSLAEGEHTAEYIVSDGTVIKLKLHVNSSEYVPAPETPTSYPYVAGVNETILKLRAKNYITNNVGGIAKYDKVPAGKAWQMDMTITHNDNKSYNAWGSCILASNSEAFNDYYWNNFQIYEHSTTHSKHPGTLNFKSSKGSDHIIAQGHVLCEAEAEKFQDYRIIIRYNGDKVYVIRTIILDEDGNETDEVYNNVWFSSRVQNEIDVMSCALPTGTNIKELHISVAEESSLLEGVEYAIQNIGNNEYMGVNASGADLAHNTSAAQAAKFMVEFTNSKDLAYHDGDGGLHNTMYIKVQTYDSETQSVVWKYVDYDNALTENREYAVPFLYSSDSKMIEPIVLNVKGAAWTIDENNQWVWDFFANYQVGIYKNNDESNDFGGIIYNSVSYTNGDFLDLPANVPADQLSNTSVVGYKSVVTKDGAEIHVAYTQLKTGFYTFKYKATSTSTTFYYDEENRENNEGCLSTYPAGVRTLWDDKGDCSRWTIAAEPSINVNLSQNRNGNDEHFYGTLYSPVAVVVPDGVKAYVAKVSLDDETKLLLSRLCAAGDVLPKLTPVILYSEETGSNTLPKTFTVASEDPSYDNANNVLTGVIYTYDRNEQKIYSLGRTKGIGFYNYTGAQVQAFKAFMLDEVASQVSAFYFVFDDGTLTKVAGLDALQTEEAPCYDLSGRMIQRPASRGLYLQSGRKMLKK